MMALVTLVYLQRVVLCAHAWHYASEWTVYLRCVLPNTCLCTASSSCQTRCSWPAAPAWSFPWLCTPLACHTYTVIVKMKAELRYCKFWGKKRVVSMWSWCHCVFSLTTLATPVKGWGPLCRFLCSPAFPATSCGHPWRWFGWCRLPGNVCRPPCMGWVHLWRGHIQTAPSHRSVINPKKER